MAVHKDKNHALVRYPLRVVLSEIEQEVSKEIDASTLALEAPGQAVTNVTAQRAAKKGEKGKPQPALNFVGIAQKDTKDPAVLIWGSAAVAKAIASESVQKKAQEQGVKFVGSVLYFGDNMETPAKNFAAAVMPKVAEKAPAKTGKTDAKGKAGDDATVTPPAE
jgi:hypothetical protein